MEDTTYYLVYLLFILCVSYYLKDCYCFFYNFATTNN